MKQDSDPCSCLLQLPGTNYTQITPKTVLIKLLEHTVEKVLTIATSGVLHQVCFNHPAAQIILKLHCVDNTLKTHSGEKF